MEVVFEKKTPNGYLLRVTWFNGPLEGSAIPQSFHSRTIEVKE
jgi:hypothetical protein